ncbi:nuclear pore complex protein DDB_G0274915 [Bicyclus anynana]|uniref:Nuclear pore complex protein DDB_G0274915 n=1 Tax=Bicyclus anynana TaxID=110368 RepID=A0A6J1N9V8_BICAN|nr:nuclear pore complex protein DDB_G0274915 [Bicyclus anynana]
MVAASSWIVIMKLVIFAALVAACCAAELDRTYLPPASAQTDERKVPTLFNSLLNVNNVNYLLPGLPAPFPRTNENIPQGVPVGSYENDHQGVVVEAAAPGTRASNQPTGLGGSRDNYGSTDSKVGAAAFRGTKNDNKPTNGNRSPQGPKQTAGQNSEDDFKLIKDTISPIKFRVNPKDKSTSYSYGFETENGIKIAAGGAGGERSGMRSEGSFSYVGDDGKVYAITYTADKGGFRPQGAHLPTPPPVPAEIAESLQQNAEDEANGIFDDGSYDAQKYNAEEDYTQSDANGDYNDRQSNQFGVRPGFGAGIDTHINQAYQGFVSPNVQGQFSPYFSAPAGATFTSGGTRFGDIKPWDKLPFQFRQPALNFGSNAFINQGQQGFLRPTVQGQLHNAFGSQFQYLPPINVQDSKPFQGNVINNFKKQPSFLGQNVQIQTSEGQSSQSQYLPPKNANVQNLKPFQEKNSSRDVVNNNFNNAPSFSEQNMQNQAYAGKPFTTQIKPSSSEAATAGQGFQNTQVIPLNQDSSGLNSPYNNVNAPQEQIFQSGSLIPDKDSLSLLSPNINNKIMFNQEKIKNPQSQGTNGQTILPNSGESKDENTNTDFSNVFSFSSSTQALPTKQPELSLTTPLENQQVQTNSAFSELGATFIDPQPQKPNSVNFGNAQSFLSNNYNQQTSGHYSSSLPEQSQGPDSSYVYNKPIKPFNSLLPQPNSNTVSSVFPSQFNSATKPIESIPVNRPDSSLISTPYEGSTGSTKYPQPTLNPISPTIATSKEKEPIFQSNGATQVSISSLPFITPTSPSQTTYSSEIYEYTKPDQGLPISNQEKNTPNSENISEKEEKPTRPQFNEQSNTQFGQRFPTPSSLIFGQQTIPSRFGIQTGSSFGSKPIVQQQFGLQETSKVEETLTKDMQTSFALKPVHKELGSQTSFSFGTQSTPPNLSTQIVNQQTTQPESAVQTSSIFSAVTSTSFDGQSIPPRFGDQANSLLGPRPTQRQPVDQTNVPFGSQTTPSHTSSISFNQGKTPSYSSLSFGTPSRFGAQTSSVLGPKPIQSQLTEQSINPFGLQTTPSSSVKQTSTSLTQQNSALFFGSSSLSGTQSRFGTQTSLTTGQKPTQSQLTLPTNLIFGSKTKPTRLDEQTSSTFGQKLNQQASCGVCGFSSGLKISPSRFVAQTGTSLNQQTTPSPFSIPSRFGVQATFGQKPSQSPLGAQSITPSRFGTRPSTSFGQHTTPSRTGIQSSSTFGQQSSSPIFGVQTSTLFGQKTTPPAFNVQTSQTSYFGKQTTASPFGIPTSTTFGQKIPQFDEYPSEQQSKDQFGNEQQQNENFSGPKQQNQSQKINEKFEIQSYPKPTTISQKETIGSGEIYQYNKPTTHFAASAGIVPSKIFSQQSLFNGPLDQQNNNITKKEEDGATSGQSVNQPQEQFGNNHSFQIGTKPNIQLGLQTELITAQKPHVITQFDQQSTTQSDQETFSIPAQNYGSSQSNVQSQVSLFPRFPEQEKQEVTNVPLADNESTQFVAPTSPSEQNNESKEITNPQLTSTSPDNTELNSQSTVGLQNKDQQSNTQSGEIYQYNKPSQSLPVPSLLANNRFGQNTQQPQFPGQSDEIQIDTTKPITSYSYSHRITKSSTQTNCQHKVLVNNQN